MQITHHKGDIIDNHLIINLLNKPEYYPYMYLVNDKFTAMCNFKIKIVEGFVFILEKF